MNKKRMRVFAGPNGSGKSTIMATFPKNINLGICVNADEIEKILKNKKEINFDDFQLKIENLMLNTFLKESKFSLNKSNDSDFLNKIQVKDNILTVSCEINSYLAADFAEFIRQQLLANDISFTYETVMSHPNKITFLKEAREKGYRVYLYFVSTISPELNVNRVKIRVAQKGHAVSEEKIRSRYYKSLEQLNDAISHTDRTYLWDNSAAAVNLFVKIDNRNKITFFNEKPCPSWYSKYVKIDNPEYIEKGDKHKM